MPSTDILHQINFHTPTWDAFILLGWVIVSVLYSLAAGRGRIITILISVYMAELMVMQAPFLSTTVGNQFGLAVYLARLITFLILFLFLFMVLSKFVFKTSVENRGFTSWFFMLIFAFLQVGFLISVILNFLPDAVKQSFAPIVSILFISANSSFIWLLLPILFLVIFGRFVSDHRIEA